MNANEVIAHRAAQILGEGAGARTVHPNDHVNLGQSSNDVFPTALRVAAVEAIERRLLPALERLEQALAARARAFPDVLKVARTHLQDAVPMRLGQELGGYASQVEHAREHIRAALPHLRELPLGGTAVGTGINTPRSFGRLAAAEIARETGLEFHEARNHFEAQAARDAEAAAGGALTAAAVGLMKIANDVRLLAMGPRSGIAEIRLPALQPGSSIMPGKVNPVICEAVIQVGAQVQACNLAIQLGAQWGQLELNAMMPLIARNLLEAIDLLANAAGLFASRCIDGLEPDPERCRELMERSLALATALSPALGYDAAAEVASEALRRGLTLRQVLRERRLLSEAEIDRLLDPARMTEPDEDPPERGAAEGR
jgi:fumarate hydratase class II